MILITGSSGSLGGILLEEISKKYKTRAILRKKPKKLLNGIDYRIGDLTNKDFILNCLDDIDIVIHLAAETRSSDKELIKESNQILTNNLINYTRIKKTKGFYFPSTILCEKKLSKYSESKSECELMIDKVDLKYYKYYRLPPLINDLNSYKVDFTIDRIQLLLSIIPFFPIPTNIIIPSLKTSKFLHHIFLFIEIVLANKDIDNAKLIPQIEYLNIKEICKKNFFYFKYPLISKCIKLFLFILDFLKFPISPTIETLYLIFKIRKIN